MKRMLRVSTFFLSGLMFFTLATAARGAAVAYEPFDYTPVGSDLLGKNGGTGFSGPWTAGGFNASIFTNYDIAAGSLPFGTLATSGEHVSTGPNSAITGLTRALSAPLGAPGTTAYLSVLIRPEGTLNAGVFNGFFGLYLNASTGNDLFIGKPGGGALGNYVVEDRGGSNQHATPDSVVVNQTVLLVLRADFTAGNDKFTLYVNPGAAEPLTGTIKNDSNVGSVGGITLYSTGAYSVDEIRIGATFADVTPGLAAPAAVPLPAAAWSGLALLASLGIHRFRRRASAA